jgi:competence protein ComEA
MRVYKDIYLNEKVVWLILLISITFNLYLFREISSYQALVKSLEIKVNEINQSNEESFEADEISIFVQIEGAIANPGVYEFSSYVRVFDVVDLAGGFLEDANRSSVNLVRSVIDGDVIYVPFSSDELNIEASFSSLININRANINDLTSLEGIGEAKAKAIISYRDKNGLFKSKEDILKVSGIGPAIYDKIESSIVAN